MTDIRRDLTHDERLEIMLDCRRVDDPCDACSGTGIHLYGSTSTWRGGMGGCAMTHDVCDTCWGSGDKHRHFTDLRKLEDGHKQRVREIGADYFAKMCGSGLSSMGQAILEVCSVLDDVSNPRKRKQRPQWFHIACEILSRELKSAVEGNRKNRTGGDE